MPPESAPIPPASQACQHLGLAHDPQTHFRFAALANQCHAGTSPNHVASDHQAPYCLVANHTSCPIFRDEARPRPPSIIGASVKGGRRQAKGTAALWPWATFGVLGALAVLGVGYWARFAPGSPGFGPPVSPSPAWAETPVETPTWTLPAAPLASLTPSPQGTAPMVPSVTPRFTPSITPMPTGALVGPYSLMVYQVRELDSLAIIAFDHKTTVAVLEHVNGLPTPNILQIGQRLVVPFGIRTTLDLPRFEIYAVPADASLAGVAAAVGAVDSELRRVNGLEQELVPAGRILFVPRAPVRTPTPAPAQVWLWGLEVDRYALVAGEEEFES